MTISICLNKCNEITIIGIYKFAYINIRYRNYHFKCFEFYGISVEPSEKQEVLVPNTLDDDGFQVVMNKQRKRQMWREYEKNLHLKLIAIGKSLAEDDMMDSDTTGK